MSFKNFGARVVFAVLSVVTPCSALADDYVFADMVESSLPSLESPFTVSEIPNGMASVSLVMDNEELSVNTSCPTPITLTLGDSLEPLYSVLPTDEASTDGRYAMVHPVNKDRVIIAFTYDPETYTMIPVTSPGVYTLRIPDGFFLRGGVEVRGSDLTYTLEGDGPADDYVFADMVETSFPSLEAPFTVSEVPNGMASVSLVMDNEELSVNTSCPTPITLLLGDSPEPLYSVLPTDEASTDGRYAMVHPVNKDRVIIAFTYDPETYTMIPVTAPGVYTLRIPDGFFLRGGVEVRGSDLTYTLEGDGPADDYVFADMVETSFPSLEAPFTVSEVPNGMASVSLVMDNEELSVNTSCPTPITLLLGDSPEPLYSVLPTDEASTDGRYAMVHPVNKDRVIIAFTYDPETYTMIPVTSPGEYTLRIPDGFFLRGGAEVRGSDLTYTLEGDEPVDPVAFSDIMISCVPPVGEPFKAEEELASGVGFLNIMADGSVVVNRSCSELLTLAKDDNPTPLCSIKSTDGVFDDFRVETVAQGEKTNIIVIFSWDPISENGVYTVTIPEGFLYCDGVPVLATELKFYIDTPEVGLDTVGCGKDSEQVIYRLDGTRVQSVHGDGIFIINGKKVVKK